MDRHTPKNSAFENCFLFISEISHSKLSFKQKSYVIKARPTTVNADLLREPNFHFFLRRRRALSIHFQGNVVDNITYFQLK